MNVMSLFAGIGALELGLERAGMNTVAQVEIDPFCQQVLARHWPGVPRHDDVRTTVEWWQSEPRPTVDVVCGGFPCQPFSLAGRQHGTADERWGWPWMESVIRAVRPRIVIVENVPPLLRDVEAFGWLLGDLHQLGFDAEWSTVTACSVGAPHVRRRLFVVAYTNCGDGHAWMGSDASGNRQTVIRGDGAARTWRDRVAWALEAACIDDRDVDGLAPRLVKAGGNAVVPQVAEFIGHRVMAGAA